MTEDSFAGSSWIDGAKYDSESQRMQVYINGSSQVYEFEGVDQETWNDFKMAKSKGSFFNKYLRGNFGTSAI